MKTVEVSRITDIPSQTIWNEMKHFDRVLNWVPGGNESSISVKGKGVGAIRDITLITQGYVQHELQNHGFLCSISSFVSQADKLVWLQQENDANFQVVVS